ncbi:hypothetical protein [Roseovarius sp. 2305UL8-3]|uniref:hypothetical protein n=1 Tax=Roseovarius conchicola TaxID=3121636 RepID=UPI0035295C94
MSMVTLIAFAPLGALVAGGLAGGVLGLYATPRASFWALGAFVVIILGLLVRLAMVGPGAEEQAFAPFVALTGGAFPALLGAVLGWFGARALARRSDS